MNYIIRLWSIIILICLLSACSSAPIKVSINSAEQLNQDQHNNPLPVQVKIYQLQDNNAFLQATFRELWLQDAETLGNSMLDKQEITINPSSKTKIVLARKKDCRYLGIVAIFLRPQGNNWRTINTINNRLSMIPLTIKVNLQSSKIMLSK
jgi:type VI secretion system protein VasD